MCNKSCFSDTNDVPGILMTYIYWVLVTGGVNL